MPKNNVIYNKFSRGLISEKALGRDDLEVVPFCAKGITNWSLGLLGTMSLRPGLEYKNTTLNSNKAYHVEFIKSLSDKTLLEFTDAKLRVYDGSTNIVRPSVSTAFTNGTFDTDVTSWTDADEGTAVSQWVTGGYLGLTGTGFDYAIRRQTLTVSAPDQNTEHALKLIVNRGKVRLRVGSTSGGSEYFGYEELEEGEHSLAFTPTGASVYVEVASLTTYETLVDSIAVESSGDMTLTSPYAGADLSLIRYEQSLDVIYIDCSGYTPYKVERRDSRSWSMVKYQPEDGPFKVINVSQITLTPSAISGDITIAASKDLFRSTHVGSLFKISSTGQQVTLSASGENQFTSEIIVAGSGSDRSFTVAMSGTWTATVTLQRSFDEGSTWVDFETYTTNTNKTVTDGLAEEVYYRIGIKTGDYTSGTASLTLDYPRGIGTGIVRITDYTDAQNVGAIVLEDLGGTAATDTWYEGAWSDFRGQPDCTKIFDGRLCHTVKDIIYHSESDGYENFSDDTVGDSKYFTRNLGRGPLQNTAWMLSLQRLLIGGEVSEYEEKASTLDEAVTASNATVKPIDSYGSSLVMARELGDGGVFIDRSGQRVMGVNGATTTYLSYSIEDLTKLRPDTLPTGVTYVRIGVQRRPDTKVHCVRSDGKVDVMVFDRTEEVKGWTVYDTTVASGLIEDVVVLPATEEDEVYYTVKRTINSVDVRYLELIAKENECKGGTLNKQLDSFYEYSGSSVTTITGLSHLEGETVYVWGNGKYLDSYTVTSGQITGLTEAVTSCVVGLAYTATWESTKPLFGNAGGTAVSQKKKVSQVGMLLQNTHQLGVQYGVDGVYDYLPKMIEGVNKGDDYVWSFLDTSMFPIQARWGTDPRINLKAVAPFPVTILALTVQMSTNDKG